MSRGAHRAPVLDAHGPLVLDLHELGRRAGSMRELHRTIAAPEDWALELVRVPTGADVSLDLRLEAVMDGVLVTGTIGTSVQAECGRCLDPLERTLSVDVQELFTYLPDPDDEEIPTVQGELIDLAPTARDAVLLGLPMNPLCVDDCPGLCPDCGARYADLPADHAHDTLDPRWAALGALHQADAASTTPDTRS